MRTRHILRQRFPALLTAVAVPQIPVPFLLPLAIAVLGDRVAIVNGAPQAIDTSPLVVAVFAAIAVAALFAALVGFGAAVAIAAGAAEGRDVTPRAAWRTALRRLPLLLLWAVVVGVALVAAVAVGWWITTVVFDGKPSGVEGLEHWQVAPVMMAVFLLGGAACVLPLSRLLVGVAPALSDGTGYLGGWREARRIGDVGGPPVNATAVVAALGTVAVAERSAQWAVLQLPIDPALAVHAGTVLASVVWCPAAAAAAALIVRPLTFRAHEAVHGTGGAERSGSARAGAASGGGAESLAESVGPAAYGLRAPALAAAVLLPSISAAAMLVVNPASTVSVTSTDATGKYAAVFPGSAGEPGASIVVDEGLGTLRTWQCGAVCIRPAHDGADMGHPMDLWSGHTPWTAAGGQAVKAGWLDARDASSHGSPFGVQTCSDSAAECTFTPLAEEQAHRGSSAAAPHGDGLVIASIAPDTPENEKDVDAPPATADYLRIHDCADAACADVSTAEVPLGGGAAAERTVAGVAMGERGEVAVLLERAGRLDEEADLGDADRPFPFFERELSVIRCSGTDCAYPTDEGLTRFGEEAEIGLGEPADIAVRPDGTPVVAYRHPETGTARSIACADTACSSWEENAVADAAHAPFAGESWHARSIGLAVGRDGNPMIATVGNSAGGVSLSLCGDPGCAEVETVRLTPPGAEVGAVDVETGGDGRPRVLWQDASDDWGRYSDLRYKPNGSYPWDIFGRWDGAPASHLVTCADESCGR